MARQVTDVAGYWPETRIFGATCRDHFLHPARFKGPRTILPHTSEQYDAQINFLLGPVPVPNGLVEFQSTRCWKVAGDTIRGPLSQKLTRLEWSVGAVSVDGVG
ncbi:uncharacterized protein B0H64DRAFT_444896 [Chaetomium fimeti]|uniref:Uncharacterized protein n=1 Tax=Chaetomium fimeti TaxID=1854472 RepID=A0AAE0LQL1_9PEZI|nr:hypothetical protein B0H64DRAFT_444896 [Chaetomium fimeti]